MAREKTCDILLKIAAGTADGVLDLAMCFVDPYGMMRGKYQEDLSLADRISITAAKAAAKRLQEKGCLEKIEKNGRVSYRITEKGRNGIEKFIFDREVWDGSWRLVIYDIPEEQKTLRDTFRRKLISTGFKQLQKSVWASPFDVLSGIENFIDENDLHDKVWYFYSNSIKNDEAIIEKFLNTQQK